jgi:2-polyprenyl-3-methyl-5-hydroxy-6-metoxy-1,4-benzoquinol methylase
MGESTLGKYDCCKRWPDQHGKLRYRLRRAQVWVSEFGFHHTGFLDAHFEGQAARPLDDDLRQYLKRELQHNSQRFERHVELVRRSFRRLSDTGVMDIGCGGGLFLSKLREAGADVVGVEVDHGRAAYCREQGLRIETEPVDSPKIQSLYRAAFDVVTLWDVIEHVNFPQDTIAKAANLLKSDGLLFLDTPCRDAFYHRCGQATYAMTGGRLPGFLDIMYRDAPFGHKQIFATWEMREILRDAGLTVVRLDKIHELSFPYAHYLKRLLRSEKLARMAVPFADRFFRVVRIKNKMIAVAQKR